VLYRGTASFLACAVEVDVDLDFGSILVMIEVMLLSPNPLKTNRDMAAKRRNIFLYDLLQTNTVAYIILPKMKKYYI
jgi:hypothetical protein